MKNKLGFWSFLVGLVLAIIISIFATTGISSLWVFLLAIIGLIVGLLNITDKEAQMFLIASIAFLISFQSLGAIFTTLTLGWYAVGTFFNMMVVFIAPATAIVAVKVIYNVSKD